MKINSIQHDITQMYSERSAGSQRFREKCVVRENNRGLKYCGSFTGKSEAATSFIDKILKSEWFGKFTKYTHDHNIATSALIALILAGVMRPATIMALPGDKDRDDKIYASGHAMASGIIGFAFSTILTSPLDEAVSKIFGEDGEKFARKSFKKLNERIKVLNLQEKAGTISEEAAKELKNLVNKRTALSTLVKNIPDWIIAVPRAMLTIALIPPILKYVFGVEKKKRDSVKNTTVNEKVNFVTDKPVFAQFKGGVK